MFRRSTVLALAALTFGVAAAWAQSSSTVTRATPLPPFGLGSTETARVTVVNAASNLSSGTAASCTGSISFLSATGTAIGSATNFTVAAGQIAAASLPFSSSGISGVRGDIRASVTLTFSTGATAPCDLQISLATFDTSTGATHLYVSAGEAVPIGLLPVIGHH